MSKLDFVQGDINHNRFFMGILIVVIFSMVGYIEANLESADMIRLVLALCTLIVAVGALVYAQIKIRKKIKSLKDL